MKLKSLTINGKTYDDFPSSDGGGDHGRESGKHHLIPTDE